MWNLTCEECNRPELAWHPSEIRRWSAKLSEFIQEVGLADMSKDDLLSCFRLLVEDLAWLSDWVSPAFMRHNSHGLQPGGLALYGPQVWRAVERRLAEKRSPLFDQMVAPSLNDYKI